MQEFDYLKFIDRILEIAKNNTKDNGWIIIEYGIRWMPVLIKIATARGLVFNGETTTLYRGGSKFLPVAVAFFRLDHIVPINLSTLENMKDTGEGDIIEAFKIIGVKPGDIVFDPCTGLGGTAQVAKKFGCRFRGNEINSKRLETAIKKLSKK